MTHRMISMLFNSTFKCETLHWISQHSFGKLNISMNIMKKLVKNLSILIEGYYLFIFKCHDFSLEHCSLNSEELLIMFR